MANSAGPITYDMNLIFLQGYEICQLIKSLYIKQKI